MMVPAVGPADAEHIRVKTGLEADHRHEDEVRRGVATTVPGLLIKREFLVEMFFCLFCHSLVG